MIVVGGRCARALLAVWTARHQREQAALDASCCAVSFAFNFVNIFVIWLCSCCGWRAGARRDLVAALSDTGRGGATWRLLWAAVTRRPRALCGRRALSRKRRRRRRVRMDVGRMVAAGGGRRFRGVLPVITGHLPVALNAGDMAQPVQRRCGGVAVSVRGGRSQTFRRRAFVLRSYSLLYRHAAVAFFSSPLCMPCSLAVRCLFALFTMQRLPTRLYIWLTTPSAAVPCN